MRLAALLLLPLLAACASHPRLSAQARREARYSRTEVPAFAQVPYEPLSRAAVVAIALREWRLFGMPVDDAAPGEQAEPPPAVKPERLEGLWQRVGEYWWVGLDDGSPERAWTGKHDEQGQVFAPERDTEFAWSAAFVSYVLRIAGAGARFPYSAAHHVYIDAAWQTAQGSAGWIVAAAPPDQYAPRPGDLACYSRTLRPLRFDDLPAGRFPAHCAVAVAARPGELDVVGGNVGDAVALTHVPTTPQGMLAPPGGVALDPRYPWFVVLRLLADP